MRSDRRSGASGPGRRRGPHPTRNRGRCDRSRDRDTSRAAAANPALARFPARTYPLLPAAVLTLSVFWIASGLFGLISFSAARSVLTTRGWGAHEAGIAVIAGAFIDIALGTLILWRAKLKIAAFGMIAASLAYLIAGTLAAPDLWADPLGPLVKVLPAITLALVVLALADDR